MNTGLIKLAFKLGYAAACRNSGFRKSAAGFSDDELDDVNYFYNNIVLPTKKEFAGRPGVDYDATNYHENYPNQITTNWVPKLDNGTAGEVHIGDPNSVFLLSGYATPSTLVHELTHLQNRDVMSIADSRAGVRPHSGISQREQGILDDAYRFNVNDMLSYAAPIRYQMSKNEEATTNREYRYKLWQDLSKKLGRRASYEEFKNHIRTMPYEDIRTALISFIPNGYQQHSLNRQVIPSPMIRSYPSDYYKLVNLSPGGSGKSIMSFEAAKNTPWYKANPKVFDKYFKDNAGKLGTLVIRPGEMLDTAKQQDLRWRSISRDWLDKIRRSWLEVASNSDSKKPQFGVGQMYNDTANA